MSEENTTENQAPIDPELSETEEGELSDAELDSQAGGSSPSFPSIPSFPASSGFPRNGYHFGEPTKEKNTPTDQASQPSSTQEMMKNFRLP
ncbi:hypothetical protein H6G52_03795 [Limnothrix sp. FACHB-881]|uniref:hypothetical protein n=1 Tax=Limnothrix sp. FACHB-881 TaxID=2692819 RepID=UPI0016850036|nr:hypothetical protein [Limnothrix sp. FACHB-881]MBD2634474.1 hypothetical protein [Limnothrix sp. FACHB-881]